MKTKRFMIPIFEGIDYVQWAKACGAKSVQLETDGLVFTGSQKSIDQFAAELDYAPDCYVRPDCREPMDADPPECLS